MSWADVKDEPTEVPAQVSAPVASGPTKSAWGKPVAKPKAISIAEQLNKRRVGRSPSPGPAPRDARNDDYDDRPSRRDNYDRPSRRDDFGGPRRDRDDFGGPRRDRDDFGGPRRERDDFGGRRDRDYDRPSRRDDFGGPRRDDRRDRYDDDREPEPRMNFRDTERRQAEKFVERDSRPPREPQEPLPVPTEPPFQAFFGGLLFEMTEDDLGNWLMRTINDLQIDDIRIPRRSEDNSSRGFAYVEFVDRESLVSALTLDGAQCEGKRLRVDVAAAKPKRQGFGGARRDDRRSGGPDVRFSRDAMRSQPVTRNTRVPLKLAPRKPTASTGPAIIPRTGDSPFGNAKPREQIIAERRARGEIPPKPVRPARQAAPKPAPKPARAPVTRGGWRDSPQPAPARGRRTERQPRQGGPKPKAAPKPVEEPSSTSTANAFAALNLDDEE